MIGMIPIMSRRLCWIRPAILALMVAALGGSSGPAQQAKPAHKDSVGAIKPKEVAFTTAVEPREARAGEVVTYRVTVQVKRPWHIYGFSKTQPETGPRATQFDFFDTAGLKPETDWTATPKPERK